MREWLIDMCLFTQAECDLVLSNGKIYVFIACIAVIFTIFFSSLGSLMCLALKGIIKKRKS